MSEDKFQNKYRIPSTRLANWDYGVDGWYFVTICTQERLHYFGAIVETQYLASLQATEIGNVANNNWLEIPQHFPFVELDEFVIMPDHVHGILAFNKTGFIPAQNLASPQQWCPNAFGPQSKNLASVIRGYKASVKKYATTHQIDFGWQVRCYDRVVRNEKELENIRLYVLNNPSKWTDNMNNPENLFM